MFQIRRVADSNGNHLFDPDGCAHVYTYDGNGNILTDRATTASGKVFLKTYTWAASLLTNETPWVPQ